MLKSNLGNQSDNYCWIHLEDLRFFLKLGANFHEKEIGQNIKINLSLKIPFENTQDKLENTLDYGSVIEYLNVKINELYHTNLLEYFCEQLLDAIGQRYKKIKAARIIIEKGYVPLANYTGKVRIEASKNF